jgi:superfamily II DNA or RNA helicase
MQLINKPTTKTLFDFQQTCLDKIQTAIAQGERKILLISVMGTGKTVMSAALIKKYVDQGKRCLFLVDLTVLINQVCQELSEWNVPYTILQAGRRYDSTSPVIVASAQTIHARVKNGDVEQLLGSLDLLVYDEAHNLTYRQISQRLYNHYLAQESVILGLTATPWRLNRQEYLGQYYNRVVVTLQPPQLIKLGRAVPCRVYGFEDYFNLDKIATDINGDYNSEDMAAQAIQTKSLEKVYTEWLRITPDFPTIAFCATVEHAKALSHYFNKQGIASAYITGDTDLEEREQIFTQMKDGSLKILTSINTLTAGFNLPLISCVLYVRLTRSKALYHQATGRAARVYPGKEFYFVLDFGANYRRLGNPMSYQNYSIDEKPSNLSKLSTKICPECGENVSIFARICPDCGHEFGVEKSDSEQEDDFELDVDKEMVEYFCREDRRRLAWFRKAKKQAYRNIAHPDSASNGFKQKYGFLPPRDWHLHAVLGADPSEKAIEDYRAYLELFAPHEFWLSVQMHFELGEISKTKTKSKKRYNRHNQSKRSQKFSTTVGAWYQTLGVSPNATHEEVKAAYRTLAKQWHPDVCSDTIAESRMKAINEAYEEFLKHRAG